MHEEKDKSPTDTAVREAVEEMGIDPRNVEIISTLPPFFAGWFQTTIVILVIGLLNVDVNQFETQTNEEVECAFWVPLYFFLASQENHVTIKRLWRSALVSVESFHYKEPATGHQHDIWGLTASICVVASSLALGELPHYPYTSRLVWKMNEFMHLKEFAPLARLAHNTYYNKHTHVHNSKL